MSRKTVSFKTKGMNRDMSVSAFSPEFSFENKNLRLCTNEGNTMMSWVCEKGTASIELYMDGSAFTIVGTVVGTAVVNHYLILFASGEDDKEGGYKDHIYRLCYREDGLSMDVATLYTGKLKLSASFPIETLVSYESETIQKVYWTDGKNQPRVINVHNVYADQEDGETYNPFDFVPELSLKETVRVRKILGANGMFSPGVIQYAFTYYNRHMQESCIFYTTPLYYISHRDRGASPEDRVDNAFQITVENVDSHFDCLRIYSIQRTSLNGTPIARRVQDIPLEGQTKVSYTDTGTSGDTIDPTELLYKGGEELSAKTLAQKDNTLFLGNLKVIRPFVEKGGESSLASRIAKDVSITPSYEGRGVYLRSPDSINDDYLYASQLTGYSDSGLTNSVPCAGFKVGDTYRFGVQFQYKDGKWSAPIYVGNAVYDKCTITTANGEEEVDAARPALSVSNGRYEVILPCFEGALSSTLAKELQRKDYRKVRPLVVFPRVQDRTALCQGVVCPTLYTDTHRNNDKDIAAQSSWFFRTASPASGIMDSSGAVQPVGTGTLPYARNAESYNPSGIRQVEVQGGFLEDNQFKLDTGFLTLHSPELQFDDNLAAMEFAGTGYRQVGSARVLRTLSDIDIQTESPTISSDGGGAIHKSFVADGMHGIVSGLFYEDYLVDDADNTLGKYTNEHSAVKWMVYLWNKDGSLNNDINRPSDKGTATAKLKKKVVSNLRFCNTTDYQSFEGSLLAPSMGNIAPTLFSSDESAFVKVDSRNYMGNIDTLLVPDSSDGQYFTLKAGKKLSDYDSSPSFTENIWLKTFANPDDTSEKKGLWEWSGTSWSRVDGSIGNQYEDLVIKRSPVRMKYKSTAHLVFKEDSGHKLTWDVSSLPVVEITRNTDSDTIFGGESKDALMENQWIPCGEPKLLSEVTAGLGKVVFKCTYGDTYFQRWDCLKTYPFTRDDTNQVVEIGSFMLETRVNIDGRYDRNRGQVSNINMSPANFNLVNPVYSQTDNFFTYRILDDESYGTSYPNQVTWSLAKTSGADVDLWTSLTMASILELDGDKGSLNKLARLNDQLIAFQDTGISQILYNENVQVSSTEGVPIEIANSGKVQGKRYLSSTTGCSNKHSVAISPNGIYFMDSRNKSICLLDGQLRNLSLSGGLNSWCKQNIHEGGTPWTPTAFGDFVSYYDSNNQDILFINDSTALAYSERFDAFTSFYDYGGVPYFVSLDGTGIWVKDGKLFRHNAGAYSYFFDSHKPYWMILAGNPEPQASKVFTNLELRATVDGDGTSEDGKFIPRLPFDYLEAWDEYQHGYASLANLKGNALMQHHTGDESSLKRKFRIWRCDIPRDNAVADKDRKEDAIYNYSTDALLNISRVKARPFDRMRNPWLYLKLRKDADENMDRTEIHDIVMTYFS